MNARIVRPLSGRIEIHGLRTNRPGEPSNRLMFKTATGMAIRPEWVPAPAGQPPWQGYWTISRAHLTAVAEAIAIRDGHVDVEMHYSQLEKCDRRCQEADGDDCTCSCEGKFHGEAQHSRWVEVGDTTLVRGTGKKVVTRRLTKHQAIADQRGRS